MITFGGLAWSGYSRDGGRYDPTADSWQGLGATWRPAARHQHAAVWTGSEMIVWGGKGLFPGLPLDAGRYDAATDTWAPISVAGAPTDRSSMSVVWTGTHLLIWGGFEYDPATGSGRYASGGGRYDPALDTWTALNVSGEPSLRSQHSTVWTGTQMIVWGGRGPAGDLGDGARYDSATDAWTSVSAVGAPSARGDHVGVWTGREMVIASGSRFPDFPPATDPGGGRYDPDLDAWAGNSDDGAQLRQPSRGVWMDGELLVIFDGGVQPQHATGERYDPVRDTWTPITPATLPVASGTPGIWVCGRGVFWGDDGNTRSHADGMSYDPALDDWSAISVVDAPQGGWEADAVRAGTSLLVFGGGPGSVSSSGGSYCVCTQDPLRVPTVFVDRTPAGVRVSWHVDAGSVTHDIVYGDLTALRTSRGDFTVATAGCAGNDVHGSSLMDPTPPGTGIWYLVRSGRPGESSTYDSGGPRQVGSRDAEIQASGLACP